MARSINAARAGASSLPAASLGGASPAKAAPQGVRAASPARTTQVHDQPVAFFGKSIVLPPIGRTQQVGWYPLSAGSLPNSPVSPGIWYPHNAGQWKFFWNGRPAIPKPGRGRGLG